MGRNSGFIAMYATLASRDVDCCLIPESPFYLEGAGGLFEYIEKRLKENGHMVIVIAEGAGQELMSQSNQSLDNGKDASGNKLFQDVGLWISQKIKDHFSQRGKMGITLKYIASPPTMCTARFSLKVAFMEQWRATLASLQDSSMEDRHTYLSIELQRSRTMS
ncbi:hypothetical protein EUGRSUZ_C00952 [Eucalyptus grandis]|uniref:Uncharacterized protein n=2 Tax=Eucalyptus grandis TaxID=71139 RepID=A0ACC3LBW2_EUCGR|nr:hypothetical protein EUGRSUZ_C00952 [Eucalyptus grandis]